MHITRPLLDIETVESSRLSLLDMFIRRTAVVTATPESIVENIVKDQWKRMNRAASPESSVGEISICNIGTLYMSKPKARKKLNRLFKYNEEITKEGKLRVKKASEQSVVKNNNSVIEAIFLKSKISKNEYSVTDSRGGEEFSNQEP